MALFLSTAGNDTFPGGLATDTVSYEAASTGVVVSLLPAPGSVNPPPQNTGHGIDTLISIENLIGGSGDDRLTGNAGANTIDGGAGLGVDTMDGGAGIDTVSYEKATAGVKVSLSIAGVLQDTGGAGFDQLSNFENLTGSAFNDVLSGDAGNNVLNGGAGIDTVSYANAGSAVTVSLSAVGAQNTVGAGSDTLIGFENLTGSNFNDTLKGNAGDNVIDGGGGFDTVSYDNAAGGVTVSLSVATPQATGGAGSDTLLNIENLTGSPFADTLSGNAGDNVLNGGAGIDTLSYANAGAGVTVNLGIAAPQNTIGAGIDSIAGFENLTGSSSADTLTGNAGANIINGGTGNDTIVGSGGIDTLTGGGGSFFRFDPLTFRIVSTPYVDRFVFNSVLDSPNASPDIITDFAPSIGEKIDVSGIDANNSLLGNQAFNWVGSIPTTPARLNLGELGYQVVGADLFLIGNTSSALGSPDFRVQLQGLGPSGGLIPSDVIL